MDKYELTFSEIRRANVVRNPMAFPQCNDWNPADWCTALAGEVGEFANIIKKIRRDGPTPELRAALKKEAADVFAYLDLACAQQEIDLGEAIVDKFNEVSAKRGCRILFERIFRGGQDAPVQVLKFWEVRGV